MTNETNQTQVAVTDQGYEVSTTISNNGNYEIAKTSDGKFKRKAIYKSWSSVNPETREQKIAMMNLLDGDSDLAQPMGEHTGAQIKVADVIFSAYDKIDEDTGEMEYGVLTYLITSEGVAYVTSSKSVYHSVKKMFMAFGEPHYFEGEEVVVQVVKKKGQKHMYTDIKIVG